MTFHYDYADLHYGIAFVSWVVYSQASLQEYALHYKQKPYGFRQNKKMVTIKGYTHLRKYAGKYCLTRQGS